VSILRSHINMLEMILVVCMIQLIPMPVLYGVFLYMGFTALPGLQVSSLVD